MHALGNLSLSTLLLVGIWSTWISLFVILWLATVGVFALRVNKTIGLRDYALMTTAFALFILYQV